MTASANNHENDAALSDEPVNPFDPDALRADPGDDDIATRRIVHHIKVRKPHKSEFFRVHPGADFTTDVYMIEAGESIERDQFLVVPALAREVLAETSRRRLFVCVNRSDTPFLWASKLPSSATTNSWVDTALTIAESAKRHWVRMIPDIGAGHYEEARAEGLLVEPKFPDLTFAQMLEKAFKNKLITDYDHEVLRALRGEI
jgi:hypothetical protein